MTNIPKRLRDYSDGIPLYEEAAAEIERLRGEIRIGADRLEIAAGVCKEWSERLRALEQTGDGK